VKFEKVVCRHLGIEGNTPALFRIAPHHFPIALLQWHAAKKKCQWMKPLTKQEAITFGTAHDMIDRHPSSNDKKHSMLFYQTPNVPKYELMMLLNSWSSERGQWVLCCQLKQQEKVIDDMNELSPMQAKRKSTNEDHCEIKVIEVSKDDSTKEMADDLERTTPLHCTQVENFANGKHLISTTSCNSPENIVHCVDMSATAICQGIWHVLVWSLLSISQKCYAALRGMALLHWKFDNINKTWHVVDCMGDMVVSAYEGHDNCIHCHNAQNSIQKETYPWLFDGVKVMPSNTEILQYIQHLYSITLHDKTEKDVNVDEFFMNNNVELHKSLLIVDNDTTVITLNGNNGSCCYLIHCSAKDHNMITGSPIPFFISYMPITGKDQLCKECYLRQ